MSTNNTNPPQSAAALKNLPACHFQWPLPPFPIYGEAQAMTEPLACEIEGLKGALRACFLVGLAEPERVIQIQIAPTQAPFTLALTQFRRLSLMAPLVPRASASGEEFSDELGLQYYSDYQVRLKNGNTVGGQTVGHVQSELGVFIFKPLNAQGCVERVFVPREMVESAEFSPARSRLPDAPPALLQDTPLTLPVGTAAEPQIVTPDQLIRALERQSKMPIVRLGEALIRLGYITDAQLRQALTLRSADDTTPLGQLLVNLGFLTRKKLNTALAHKMGYPMVNVAQFPIDTLALRKVSLSVAQRLAVLPLLLRPNLMVVAAADPTLQGMVEELEFLVQVRVVAVLGDVLQILNTTNSAYQKLGYNAWAEHDNLIDFSDELPALTSGSELLESMEIQERFAFPEIEEEPQIAQSDNSLVRLINTMIVEAQARGVSDIHVECLPRKAKVRIRFRCDGVMSPYLELPHTYRSALVARLKIMADLDISEHRKPQDGKIDFRKFSAKHRLELRIATIPTANGLEDVVMRLLSSAKPIALDKLGLSQANFEQLRDAVSRPYGMVLCVGPTGSGKTTTLHSVLSYLSTPERKIWTAEDPIEITQPDLRQVQVNPQIEWTFAKALRAFLRADPDVIMVGEIRDEETAHMAIEASLTGHLLLSTLHTNSAAETVTRLIDMGMNPFNFADSLLAVLAQRLVRRLCRHCCTSEVAAPTWVNELLDDYLLVFPQAVRPPRAQVLAQWQAVYGQDGGLRHFHAPGCSHCHDSGLSGRMGLHELMRVTPALRSLIQSSAPAERVQQEAFKSGQFCTLRQDGILKVLQGLTSMEEVRANSNA